MKKTYLSIALVISEKNRAAAAEVYAKYKQPFLVGIKGALSKELLVGPEEVVVLHGFDSKQDAENYLKSDLFTKDVVSGLQPYLEESPNVKIYSVV